ncbi:MAG: hypothetical protein OEV61_05190 [Chloroflexota bacterium]|nr:hypothetical protein [Chloroflexota bacterium]
MYQPDDANFITRAHAWVLHHWPTTLRRRVAVVAVLVATSLVLLSWLGALLETAVDLGLLAIIGLMVVCWVGAGGALVPVPGVRPLSWVMIVNQGAVLDPLLVAILTALAMALGQSSYFVATRAGKHHHEKVRDGDRASGRHHDDDAATTVAGVASAGRDPSEPPGSGGRSTRLVTRARSAMSRAREYVERRMHRHPQRTVFALSLIPNPLTTFATVTAAAIGMEYGRFFAASLAGFLVLTSVLVIAGQGILLALGIST